MKKYTAELIGTFALVFIGAGAGCMNASLPAVAFAHGLTIVGMIYALGHISGIHINPAVTVAMKVTGKIDTADAVAYIIAQLAGAALAAFALSKLVTPTIVGIATAPGNLGATLLSSGISPTKGLFLEALGTFLFATVIFGAAVDGRTAGNNVGLAIGLTLAGLIMFMGPLTGASFNPARSFGPALIGNNWNDFWVYIIGPVAGASAAGIVQTKFFMKS